MQDVIKRYFWVVGAASVVVSAVFAAKATGHIIEAKLLGDAPKSPKVTPVERVEPIKPTRSKDGTQLASRNMFCSECSPAPVATNTDPSQISLTSLPLVLVVTNVSTKDKDSYAIVINTESQRQGAFSIGDVLPGATGKVKAIRFKFIDFEHNGRIERLGLQGAQPPTTVAIAEPPPPVAEGENKDELQAAIDNGIKKIDDTNFEIDKSLVDKVLVNPMAVAKGARVVPSMKNGKADGFKLYAIRPTSVFAKLG
ncbi:MAG: type II secretion system protein GspC, partial [Kofleriaceae bacterium]